MNGSGGMWSMQAISAVVNDDNIALEVADLPARLLQLSKEDNVLLLACTNNYVAIDNLAACITQGLHSRKCESMNNDTLFAPLNLTSVEYHHIYQEDQ